MVLEVMPKMMNTLIVLLSDRGEYHVNTEENEGGRGEHGIEPRRVCQTRENEKTQLRMCGRLIRMCCAVQAFTHLSVRAKVMR